MDVLKEIARLEVLMEAAKADGKVGMALWYEIRIDELKYRVPTTLSCGIRNKQLLNLTIL